VELDARAGNGTEPAALIGVPNSKRVQPTTGIASLAEANAVTVTRFAGSTPAFCAAVLVVVVWAVTGPWFDYSQTWQMIINTSTTIVTFLMVFLIQRSQNKDALAVHLKLNELVAAVKGASNRLVDAEELSEKELEALHLHYAKLAELAKEERDLRASHSVEEAGVRQRAKRERGARARSA
jgi:low affinity Fe/Cu permease